MKTPICAVTVLIVSATQADTVFADGNCRGQRPDSLSPQNSPARLTVTKGTIMRRLAVCLSALAPVLVGAGSAAPG